MKYFQMIALIALASILFSSINISTQFYNPAFGQFPVIDGIRCDDAEHFNYHYHAHLDIFVNGFSYLIPAGIGIRPPNCIYWLHTHDISGIIHVESPDNRTFTLGQFFDMWGKDFNNTEIFDFIANKSDNRDLVVYVNGTAMTDSQYRDIPIVNHKEIAIVYGTPPLEIPPYEFQY